MGSKAVSQKALPEATSHQIREDKLGSQGRVIKKQFSIEFSYFCLSRSKLSFQECIENALAREKQRLLPGKRADLCWGQFGKNSVSLQGEDWMGLLAGPCKRLGSPKVRVPQW